MDTNNLMSSLREMIKAEVDAAVHTQAGRTVAADTAREQYSRHETVVREQLAELGKQAGQGTAIYRVNQPLR